MSLPTETSPQRVPVGLGGDGVDEGGISAVALASPLGFFEYVGEIDPLATPVEFMRFCPKCDTEQIFVAKWQCEQGLVGCCQHCGDERIAPFTRTNTES